MVRLLALLLLVVFANPARAGAVVALFGDSRTAGSVGPSWWGSFLTRAPYLANAKVADFSIASKKLATLNAEYEATGHAHRPGPDDTGVAFIYAGVNDFYFDKAITGADVYALLVSLTAKARADRYHVVLITETCGASLGEDQALSCADYNRLIMTGPKLWDYLVRADLEFPDHSDRSIYLDGVHFTAHGQNLLGLAIEKAIEARGWEMIETALCAISGCEAQSPRN